MRQCDLLGLSRSSYYYQYAQANDATEKLMRLIDERYTEYPFEGSRRIAIWLQRNGHEVSRDQVRYLMRKMGLQAIYPKPNISAKSRFEHVIYPYLLNKVCVYYPNQVLMKMKQIIWVKFILNNVIILQMLFVKKMFLEKNIVVKKLINHILIV